MPDVQHLQIMNEDGDILPLADLEREVIRRAIELYHGNMSMVAVKLGIGRSTLYRKINEEPKA